MTDIRRSLIEEDPIVAEPTLPASAVREIRRHIMAAESDGPPFRWTLTLTLASALVATVAAGMATTWPGTPAGQPITPQPKIVATHAPGGGHRQLQFATPAGTRVIWQFNSDFDMGIAR